MTEVILFIRDSRNEFFTDKFEELGLFFEDVQTAFRLEEKRGCVYFIGSSARNEFLGKVRIEGCVFEKNLIHDFVINFDYRKMKGLPYDEKS